MRIILKPGGIALVLAIGILWGIVLANRKRARSETTTPHVSGATRQYVVVEAETLGTGEVRTDKTASGEKYVHVTGDYEPMAQIPCPAGTAFTLWARVRQTAVQTRMASKPNTSGTLTAPARFSEFVSDVIHGPNSAIS